VFFSTISSKTLAILCKSLATMQHAGVPLLKTLDTLAKKTGDSRCRDHLAAVRDAVKGGTDIAAAMRERGSYFPELTIDMIAVGEQTGSLPEVLDALAAHYENLVRLRRNFLGQIAWPAIQLVAAIFIIAGVIFLLGFVASTSGGKPVDMLGLGLVGTAAAIKFLAVSFGSIFAILGGYYVAAHTFRQKRFLDGLLMRIPVLGNCMRDFAVARFSWGFALTQQAGMQIGKSLEASFKATGNGAFVGASDRVVELVMSGEELSTALEAARLFPEEYLQIVQVAETSGTVPETLARLSPQFEEQARRSLSMLATALAWLVWCIVAGLIIYVIFSVVAKYVGLINAAASGNLDAF
jgi:type IV pilus assembly protein PilC